MNFIKELENLELIEILRENGFVTLVDALLEQKVYTKKGKLNKSALCRFLNCRPYDVEAMLAEACEFLKSHL